MLEVFLFAREKVERVGRTKGGKHFTDAEIKEFVNSYIELGNYQAVADKYTKPESSVRYAIERFRMNNLEEFNKIRSYYLEKQEQAFIDNTTKAIAKAVEKINEKLDTDDNTIAQISTTMGILYDKRALTMGKSTSNNAVVITMSKDLEDLAK